MKVYVYFETIEGSVIIDTTIEGGDFEDLRAECIDRVKLHYEAIYLQECEIEDERTDGEEVTLTGFDNGEYMGDGKIKIEKY